MKILKIKEKIENFILKREDWIAIIVILVCTLLTAINKIDSETFIWVISVILSYYFGRTSSYEIIMRRLKNLIIQRNFLGGLGVEGLLDVAEEIEDVIEEYREMWRRFGAVLLISGCTLILEKYIMSGASLSYPPLADHAVWGLIMLIFGWIILIRREKND